MLNLSVPEVFFRSVPEFCERARSPSHPFQGVSVTGDGLKRAAFRLLKLGPVMIAAVRAQAFDSSWTWPLSSRRREPARVGPAGAHLPCHPVFSAAPV